MASNCPIRGSTRASHQSRLGRRSLATLHPCRLFRACCCILHWPDSDPSPPHPELSAWLKQLRRAAHFQPSTSPGLAGFCSSNKRLSIASPLPSCAKQACGEEPCIQLPPTYLETAPADLPWPPLLDRNTSTQRQNQGKQKKKRKGKSIRSRAWPLPPLSRLLFHPLPYPAHSHTSLSFPCFLHPPFPTHPTLRASQTGSAPRAKSREGERELE